MAVACIACMLFCPAGPRLRSTQRQLSTSRRPFTWRWLSSRRVEVHGVLHLVARFGQRYQAFLIAGGEVLCSISSCVLSDTADVDEPVCGPPAAGQLLTVMGYLRGLDQDNSIRWKARSDQDEGDRESSASGWPLNSPPEHPRLPLRQRSVYPLSDPPSTAGFDAVRFHGRTAADVSTLPRDLNPLGHLRSSMGRLSLQDSEGLVRIPRRAIRQKTLEEDLGGSSISSGTTSPSDGSISSCSPPETRPPISVRSHIAGQLKVSDHDRNGMRIRRSQESDAPKSSEKKDRKRVRHGDIGLPLPTTPKEMESSRKLPDRGIMISHVRQRKKRSEFGLAAPSSGCDDGLIHHHLPSLEV